jgi:hypothetical protein
MELVVAAAEDERFTSSRPGEPEQEPQGGRLAGAVRAQEAGYRASLERERQVLNGDQLAVVLRQRVDADDWLARRRLAECRYAARLFVDLCLHACL